VLELRGLNVKSRDLQLLWDIDLRVEAAEIVVIVGANGAGKSTMLKAISRLVAIEAVALDFDGCDLRSLEPQEVVRLGIVQVPEGRHIFPELTVAENLRVGSYTQTARRTRAKNLDRVFELFPRLAERRHQLGGTLSGGEQQMLAMARGLMSNPKLMLLDEPSLGLSPLLCKQMFQIVREIHRQGIGVLLVEQNVYQSLRIADRAYVLENGRIIVSGTGAGLLADDYVKTAFLGMQASDDESRAASKS
jgi:branched-chain amino acid transport system ATP-binding protein